MGCGGVGIHANAQSGVLGFEGSDRIVGQFRCRGHLREGPPVGPIEADASAGISALTPVSSSFRVLHDLDPETRFVHRPVVSPTESTGELRRALIGGPLDTSAFPPIDGDVGNALLPGRSIKEITYRRILGEPYFMVRSDRSVCRDTKTVAWAEVGFQGRPDASLAGRPLFLEHHDHGDGDEGEVGAGSG